MEAGIIAHMHLDARRLVLIGTDVDECAFAGSKTIPWGFKVEVCRVFGDPNDFDFFCHGIEGNIQIRPA